MPSEAAFSLKSIILLLQLKLFVVIYDYLSRVDTGDLNNRGEALQR